MATTTGPLSQLENTLEEYFVTKAPFQLPPDVKEALVKFGPWLIIVLLILSLPMVIGALTLGSFMMPGAMMYRSGGYWLIPAVVMLISVIFEVLALPGLFNRTMQGWRYMFYAQLLSIVSSLLYMNIVGTILGAIIGFYILFQVKDKYK